MSRVAHFEICADDVDRAVSFYRHVFGWEIRRWDGPHDYWVVITGDDADVPGINLSFEPSSSKRAPTQGRAIDHIGFEVDGLEAFCEMLVKRGVEFQLAYRNIQSIELAIAFFTDPSGVRIELTEGFDKY